MPEFISSAGALTVFLVISALGFVFLVISLIFGEIFEVFGIDVQMDGGVDGHGLLDSRAISVFITTFGGVGAIATQLGLAALPSALLGLAAGIACGALVSLFARFLYKQQASSSVSAAQLVGRSAQVTVTIPAGGIGQISCRIGEERVERIARSRDSSELRSGTLVVIEAIAGDSLIVSAASDHLSFQSEASKPSLT